MKTFLTICALTALGGGVRIDSPPGTRSFSRQDAPPAPKPPSVYVPQRVYDTQGKVFTDFEMMEADLARADVVLLGEQHDDANTHRLETAILEGLARRRVPVTLSLEMFERDVQPSLDTYVAGTSVEAEFLKGARPWPRYATDYRPLVEFAKSQHWPVVAANVPRRIASDIARSGRPAVDSLSEADRRYAANDLRCPHDGYFDRFAEQMGGHQAGAPGATGDSSTERYYWAQCVKDETMATRRPSNRRRTRSPVPAPKSLWNAPVTWTTTPGRPSCFANAAAIDSAIVSSLTHWAQ